MVMLDHRNDIGVQAGRRLDETKAQCNMLADDGALDLIQRTRPGEHVARHLGIADIQQQPTQCQRLQAGTVKPQVPSQDHGPDRTANRAPRVLCLALAEAHQPCHRILVAQDAVDQWLDRRLEACCIQWTPLLELFQGIVHHQRGGVIGRSGLRRLDPGRHQVPVVPCLEEGRQAPAAIEMRDGIEQPPMQAARRRMLQPVLRRLQRTRVAGLASPCRQHRILRHGTAGGIDIDVLAIVPQLMEIIVVADFEALEQERSLQPWAIELCHVHAALEVGGCDLQSFEEHGQSLAAGIRPAGTVAMLCSTPGSGGVAGHIFGTVSGVDADGVPDSANPGPQVTPVPPRPQ